MIADTRRLRRGRPRADGPWGRDVEPLLAAGMIVVALGALAAGVAVLRRPIRLALVLGERTWREAFWWTTAITFAAAAGAMLGGSAELAAALLLVGGVVALVVLRGWVLARGSDDRG